MSKLKKSNLKYLFILIGIIILGTVSVIVLSNKANNQSSSESFEYVNEADGYAIGLPTSIKDRVGFSKEEGAIEVYSKKIRDDGTISGTLIYVYKQSKNDFPKREDMERYAEDGPVPITILGETQTDYICYSPATDVQYLPENELQEEEYRELEKLIREEGVSFRLIN